MDEKKFCELLDAKRYENGHPMLPRDEYRAWLAQNILDGLRGFEDVPPEGTYSSLARYAIEHEHDGEHRTRAAAVGMRTVLPKLVEDL